MFVTANQFGVFVACFSIGGVCGALFSISALFKFVIKSVKLSWIFDVFAFILTSVIYVYTSHKLNFPNYRAYMTVGVFVGIFVYLKSFHILLAKSTKKIYNIIKTKIAKVRHDRIKDKKVDSGGDSRCGAFNRNTFDDNGLPTHIGKCGKEAH